LQASTLYSFTSKEANWQPLNPPSQGLRICVQVSRLLEGAVVLIWHGVWTLTDILTTGMVELLLKINTKKSETSTKNDVQQFHLSLLRQSKRCLASTPSSQLTVDFCVTSKL